MRAAIVGGALAIALVLLGLFALASDRRSPSADDDRPSLRDAQSVTRTPPSRAPAGAPPSSAMPDSHQGLAYGRVTTDSGDTYEGRLRWGGDEEASWSDYFQGFKAENIWATHVPPERLKESNPVEIFGLKVGDRERQIDLRRPFLARLGDIAQIELLRRHVRVTLKSGTAFDLDRFSADDFADGLRVWDAEHGVVDLREQQVRTIQLLATPELATAPSRIHGTVRSQQQDFTGFIQWDREQGLGSDELRGDTSDGELSLRFDTIRSIVRHSATSSLVELVDGRKTEMSGTRHVGRGNRGVYVDDPRYGKVLIAWTAFERIDFTPSGSVGSGPHYNDFPEGGALIGSVTDRAGTQFAGRLVYDLDESETTETLDAPMGGVNYTIPFGMIASIQLAGGEAQGGGRPTVTLHNGHRLSLEPEGDLDDANAGMLIFVEGRERPEYLPWAEVARIDLATGEQ